MNSPNPLLILYALATAASWGAADFTGGLATKRSSVHTVILVSQGLGLLLLMACGLAFGEPLPCRTDLFLGMGGGTASAVGLVALYRGLAFGRMGFVAPVAAVIAAIIPVMFGFILEGAPSQTQSLGFGLALISVWLISGTGDMGRPPLHALGFPVTAGMAFALLFIFIDRMSDTALFWPLAAARMASISWIGVFVLAARHRWERPRPGPLVVMLLTGIFDTVGNVFFVLATHAGRLDVSTMLSSLYPAATVFLAWIIIGERFSARQWTGIVAALLALAFIAS